MREVYCSNFRGHGMNRPGLQRGALVSTSALLLTFVLAGCVHRAPISIHDGIALISGHNTVHASASDARETVLIEAASITLDHGYRYFQLMTQIRPGADVTIRVYGKGEINPRAPNVYDANDIAAGKMRPTG